MAAIEALQPAIVLLGAGTAAALASRAVHLSPMVGYILAGIAIGPYGLNALEQGDTTALLAEMGVVFLLFDIGLHFSVKEMNKSRRDIFGLAPLQMLLCSIVFVALAYAMGLSWPIAIAIGVSLALSSTAVVTRILAEKGLNTTPLGRSSVAVLIFQDVIAIFLLIFANSLADDPGQLAGAMAIAAGQAAIAFIAAALAGRYIVRPIFQILAATHIEEIFTMMAIFIVVATAFLTASIGLSLTLGAFLAGMAIADTPYRHAIQTEVRPFRSLLLSFFFVNVGLLLDVSVIGREWAIIILAAIAIMLSKTVLVFLAARLNRWSVPGATQLAFMLSQASEFTLIVLSIAAIRAETPSDIVAILIAATALSLALAPFWVSLGLRLSRIVANRLMSESPDLTETQAHSAPPDVIIYGMTEPGRFVIDALIHENIPHIALDSNPKRFSQAIANGYEVVFGDSSDFRLIESLKAGKARAIVLGEPRFEISRGLTEAVQTTYPNMMRFVAVSDANQHSLHKSIGMSPRLIKTHMDAIAFSAEVLRTLGVAEARVTAWTETEIERFERDKDGHEAEEELDEAL